MSTTVIQSTSYNVRQWIKNQQKKGIEPNADAIWAKIRASSAARMGEIYVEEIFQHVARLEALRRNRS